MIRFFLTDLSRETRPLGKRSQQFKVDELGRTLLYILALRPDEFGLVPNPEGFVSLKELLQALHEEAPWRYVRRSHLNEVLLGVHRAGFEMSGDAIRALERKWRFEPHAAWEALPKILFAPVRRRAHPVVLEKGLKPPDGGHLVLSPEESMARRIGMRRDQQPVLVEVRAREAARHGVRFCPFGELLLAFEVPPEFIAGPPVPRETVERQAAARAKTQAVRPEESAFTAGTFILEPSEDPDRRRRHRGKKSKGWKEDARKMRRRKSRIDPSS